MTHGTVVLLGNAGWEANGLNELVREFDWILERAADLDELRNLNRQFNVVAVVFDPRSMDLAPEQALPCIRAIEPEAMLIPCLRFSEVSNWPELADAGAFHALALPLQLNEVRQSLSFVWSARMRRAAKVVPMARGKRSEPTAERAASAESSVA